MLHTEKYQSKFLLFSSSGRVTLDRRVIPLSCKFEKSKPIAWGHCVEDEKWNFVIIQVYAYSVFLYDNVQCIALHINVNLCEG